MRRRVGRIPGAMLGQILFDTVSGGRFELPDSNVMRSWRNQDIGAKAATNQDAKSLWFANAERRRIERR